MRRGVMTTHCSMAGEQEARSRAKVTPNLAPRTILPRSLIPDAETWRPPRAARGRGSARFRRSSARRTAASLSMVTSGLVAEAHALKAVAAIDRLVVARQEWHLILFATLGAGNDVHLARAPVPPAGGHRLLAALATLRAATWFVEQSFLLVKLLLP